MNLFLSGAIFTITATFHFKKRLQSPSLKPRACFHPDVDQIDAYNFWFHYSTNLNFLKKKFLEIFISSTVK